MKIFISILGLLFFSKVLFSQPQIPIDSVSSYVSKVVKVCDKVAGIFVTKGEKPVTYLSLGADYPNTKLTIVIFQKDLINFPYPPADHYKGQNVCVTGEVGVYKERYQIISNKPEQIEVK
ncbi:MAG TPA: hypothetical protein PKD51_20835 [Saprospiraceae bacterium]|nr:hypothetical protein [Saprospiraceae bacterium]